VLLGLGPAEFAAMAARALTPRPEPTVSIEHAHGGAVSVREQTALLLLRLQRNGGGSFRGLTADCNGTLEVVARFLGLLELYREGLVAFEQAEALGELHVRWTGSEATDEESSAGAEWDESDEQAVAEEGSPHGGTDQVIELDGNEEPR
jgi:segregation and condensation protein A